MWQKTQVLIVILLILGGCVTTSPKVPSTREADQLNRFIMPEFPLPGKAVIKTLQGLKKENPKESEVLYGYFGKLMIFDKQYQVLLDSLDINQ